MNDFCKRLDRLEANAGMVVNGAEVIAQAEAWVRAEGQPPEGSTIIHPPLGGFNDPKSRGCEILIVRLTGDHARVFRRFGGGGVLAREPDAG
jgi:hypothetical protein